MARVRPYLIPDHHSDERGYTTYIDLLKSIAKQCDEKSDILTIEMTLFANAPLLAERFSVGKF